MPRYQIIRNTIEFIQVDAEDKDSAKLAAGKSPDSEWQTVTDRRMHEPDQIHGPNF
jgi:hypothetical protein